MGFEVTLKPLFVCFYVFLLCWSLDDGELRARLLPVWTWVSGVSDLLFLHILCPTCVIVSCVNLGEVTACAADWTLAAF